MSWGLQVVREEACAMRGREVVFAFAAGAWSPVGGRYGEGPGSAGCDVGVAEVAGSGSRKGEA